MTAAPIFLSRPCLVIGTPVALLIFCLIAVIPNALLSENDNPGILMIILSVNLYNRQIRNRDLCGGLPFQVVIPSSPPVQMPR